MVNCHNVAMICIKKGLGDRKLGSLIVHKDICFLEERSPEGIFAVIGRSSQWEIVGSIVKPGPHTLKVKRTVGKRYVDRPSCWLAQGK